MNNRVLLPKDVIDHIADNSTDHVDFFLGLYNYVFKGEWHQVKRLEGYPIISVNTYNYIESRCPNNVNDFRMLWINKGFSTCNEMTEDFVVDNSKVKLIF